MWQIFLRVGKERVTKSWIEGVDKIKEIYYFISYFINYLTLGKIEIIKKWYVFKPGYIGAWSNRERGEQFGEGEI